MPEAPTNGRAADHFDVVVLPARRGQNLLLGLFRLGLWFIDGSDGDTSSTRVEVRERTTGRVVFEDAWGGVEMAEALELDLDRLAVGEFRDHWGLANPDE